MQITNEANPTKEIGSSRMAKKMAMVMVKRELMLLVMLEPMEMVKRVPIETTEKWTKTMSIQRSIEMAKEPMMPQFL